MEHGNVDQGRTSRDGTLIVDAEVAMLDQPGEGALHRPALGSHREAAAADRWVGDDQVPTEAGQQPGRQAVTELGTVCQDAAGSGSRICGERRKVIAGGDAVWATRWPWTMPTGM